MYSDFATEDPPFSLLSDAERQRAIRAMDIHFYSAGDPLIEAGRESGFVFVVDKGLVEERDPAAADTDHAVAHYRDGEVFVLEVNGVPGWKTIGGVCDVDV